ncbi:hypothetical protein [Tenacibaculum xiamenense]
MKKLLQFFELIRLLILLPFKISNGKKKQAYKKIKQQMISVNLL